MATFTAYLEQTRLACAKPKRVAKTARAGHVPRAWHLSKAVFWPCLALWETWDTGNVHQFSLFKQCLSLKQFVFQVEIRDCLFLVDSCFKYLNISFRTFNLCTGRACTTPASCIKKAQDNDSPSWLVGAGWSQWSDFKKSHGQTWPDMACALLF